MDHEGGRGGEKFGNSTNYFSSGFLKAVKSGSTGDGQAALTLANGWLNNFVADTALSSLALVSGSRNDQFMGIPNAFGAASVATPLPAALPGGVALIVGLGLSRKLRKQRKA